MQYGRKLVEKNAIGILIHLVHEVKIARALMTKMDCGMGTISSMNGYYNHAMTSTGVDDEVKEVLSNTGLASIHTTAWKTMEGLDDRLKRNDMMAKYIADIDITKLIYCFDIYSLTVRIGTNPASILRTVVFPPIQPAQPIEHTSIAHDDEQASPERMPTPILFQSDEEVEARYKAVDETKVPELFEPEIEKRPAKRPRSTIDKPKEKVKPNKKSKRRESTKVVEWDNLGEDKKNEHISKISMNYNLTACKNQEFFTSNAVSLKDKVSLILTDPPYGVFTKFEHDKVLSTQDMAQLLENCYHILKPHGNIVIFSTWQQSGEWDKLLHSMIKKFVVYKSALYIVREPNAGFIQRGGSNMQNMVETAIVAYKKGKGHHSFNWQSNQVYLDGGFSRGTNVINEVPIVKDKLCDENGNEFRIEEKNVDMLKEIVARFSNRGDLVCDPYAGTGTTMLACYELGRFFTGCEMDKSLVKAAWNRFCCDSYTSDQTSNFYFDIDRY